MEYTFRNLWPAAVPFHPELVTFLQTCHLDEKFRVGMMADNKSKTPFYLIDTQSEFYRPLGTRLAICAAVALWALLEIWHTDPFWSVISGACAVYCVYVLFLTYKPPQPKAPEPQPSEDGEEGA